MRTTVLTIALLAVAACGNNNKSPELSPAVTAAKADPPPVGKRGTGTVAGTITSDGKTPIPNLTLDICVGDCTGETPRWTLVTGTDGTFEVADVEIIEYPTYRYREGSRVWVGAGTLIKAIGDRRKPPQRFECCLQLEDGGRLDVGTLTYIKPTP